MNGKKERNKMKQCNHSHGEISELLSIHILYVPVIITAHVQPTVKGLCTHDLFNLFNSNYSVINRESVSLSTEI